jgi:hypothetical protein
MSFYMVIESFKPIWNETPAKRQVAETISIFKSEDI